MNRKSTPPRFAVRPLGLALAAGLIAALASPAAMAQEKVLRIAMTAADIPRTLGQPDQGFEGNRFTGIPMYDALTHWDLSKSDAASVLIPGLATSWAAGATDKTKWIFKLRPGVKFHDGSDLTADSVVWNVQKVLDKDAVHFDASQVGVTASRMPTLRSARKIDNLTVELTTSEPDAFLPLNLTNLFMASPAHWQKKFEAAAGATPAEKSKNAWIAFAADASGSGPFKMARFLPRERLETRGEQGLLGPQAHTQDRPRGDDAHARSQRAHGRAALRPGRLDRGALRPTPCRRSRSAATRSTSTHSRTSGPGSCSFAEGSPWLDKRVRHAANLCVDRLGLMKLLGRHDGRAQGHRAAGPSVVGQPQVRHQVRRARGTQADGRSRLSAAKPLKVKVQISASGSGQMQPLPMNEFVQQSAQAVLHRRRVRRHRMEHAVHQLAQGCQRPVGQRHATPPT